ncbi:MAG TPA: hypothetical protein PKL48_03975 [Thermodesulfobacteriota bacterium]|nr:hypothetical protein [Thermodesulfobacteriota bacterium]
MAKLRFDGPTTQFMDGVGHFYSGVVRQVPDAIAAQFDNDEARELGWQVVREEDTGQGDSDEIETFVMMED